MERTALDFSGYFDTRFWTMYLPQVSFSEPAVRDAVIALGAVHRNYEMGVESWNSKFALAQYTKAVSGLRRILAANQSTSAEMALTFTLLFTAIETFQGNHKLASNHLKGGLTAMGNQNLRRISSSAIVYPLLTNQTMDQFLDRLELFAMTFFDVPPSLADGKKEVLAALPCIPDEFATFDEARNRLFEQARPILVSYRMKAGATLDGERDAQVSYLLRWSQCWGSYMKKHERKMSTKQFQAATLLRIYRETCYIILMLDLWQPEEGVEALEDQFARLVTLSDSLFQNPDPSSFEHPTFSLDSDVLPPLYLLACRCRNSVIRYQTPSFWQRTHRWQGKGNGKGAYKVAERFSAIEEEAVVGSGLIRETSPLKARNVDCLVWLEERKLLMRYCQKYVGDGTTVWRQHWIAW